MNCNRCRKEINDSEREFCWYCCEDLCNACWEAFGHCGHKKAEEANEYCKNFKPGDKPLPRMPWGDGAEE